MTSRSSSIWRTRLALAAVCVAVVGAASGVAALMLDRRPHVPRAELYEERSDGGALAKLWTAPDFALRDQNGGEVTAAMLRGRPYVVDFFFTQCATACPMMTAKMVQLEHALDDRDLRFVSFSVDPEHDTSSALAAYATHWNADDPRWLLLASDAEQLAAVTAGYRVAVRKTDDATDPILHSTIFFLVDADGDVRGVYDSAQEGTMAALERDARILAAPRGATTDAGTSLVASLGCNGCHDRREVAPPLFDLAGPRHLADGRTVDADDAYLTAAIVDPGRDRVDGYSVTMPSYRAHLSDAQLTALVAELRARHADGGAAPSTSVRVVTDPVCKMKVRTEPSSPHVTVNGAEHWFCSEMCRDTYAAHPEKYRDTR